MNIVYCIAFGLVAIFEFSVCKCIKDIYERLCLLEYHCLLSGDPDE